MNCIDVFKELTTTLSNILIVGNYKNFYHFALKNLLIRTKSNLITQFVFNSEQLFINKVIEAQISAFKKVRIIILKGRQIGTTTMLAGRGYYLTTKYSGYKSFVLSHRRSSTNNIFDIIYRYYANFPSKIQPKISALKHKEIKFLDLDSSYMFATAGSNDVARGDTIQFFHGSEVAFWKNSDNHLASILMAVPDCKNTEIYLESTSNGPNGAFYELCMESKAKKNEYELIFLPWYWHKEYRLEDPSIKLSRDWLDYGKRYSLDESQIKWAYLKSKMLDISTNNNNDGPCVRFYQEFPGDISEAFKFSKNNNLISLESLLKVAYKENFKLDNNIIDFSVKQQFLDAKKNDDLVFGVDIATGGNDLSWIIDRQGAFLGFNLNESNSFTNTMEIVGWIFNNIKKYNPSKVYIDAGGGGIGVFDRLKEIGFEDIVVLVYFAQKADDDRKYLNKRAEMWCRLKEFIEMGNFIINDSILLHQLSSLEYSYNSKGQIQLENKDKLKARLKSSPDGADACALTFGYASNTKPKTYSFEYNKNTYSTNDFNPFEW